jgi:prepilin-type N-terminal cleavage/methylation domain-containing protein
MTALLRRRRDLLRRLEACIDGFTLIEVMTVVAVIAILSGIAIYSINLNLDRIRADNGVRELSLVLNYARIRAVSENTNYVVTFKVRPTTTMTESKCYVEMFADTNKNGTFDAGEKKRTEDMPKGIVYDLDGPKDIYNIAVGSADKDGVIFPGKKVTFTARGNAADRGEVYIIPSANLVRGIDNNRRAVSLENLSGKTIAWYYDVDRAAAGKNPWKLAGE